MNTSITPDISLQISPQRRINDSYDYDGDSDGNIRPHYHFSTSPAIPAQSPISQFNLTQTPLKKQTQARAGIPSVCDQFFFGVVLSKFRCKLAMVGQSIISVGVQVSFSSAGI